MSPGVLAEIIDPSLVIIRIANPPGKHQRLIATHVNPDVTLTFTLVQTGSLGTATLTDANTGSFSYTPIPGVTGSDDFFFKVNDGTGNSNIAGVSVTIIPLNDTPAISSKKEKRMIFDIHKIVVKVAEKWKE